MVTTVKAGIANDQELIKKAIKRTAENFKNLETSSPAKYLLPRNNEVTHTSPDAS